MAKKFWPICQWHEGDHDVLVVDRMLPGGDGLSIVRSVRAAGIATPVLFLTAVGGVGDRVPLYRQRAGASGNRAA